MAAVQVTAKGDGSIDWGIEQQPSLPHATAQEQKPQVEQNAELDKNKASSIPFPRLLPFTEGRPSELPGLNGVVYAQLPLDSEATMLGSRELSSLLGDRLVKTASEGGSQLIGVQPGQPKEVPAQQEILQQSKASAAEQHTDGFQAHDLHKAGPARTAWQLHTGGILPESQEPPQQQSAASSMPFPFGQLNPAGNWNLRGSTRLAEPIRAPAQIAPSDNISQASKPVSQHIDSHSVSREFRSFNSESPSPIGGADTLPDPYGLWTQAAEQETDDRVAEYKAYGQLYGQIFDPYD